MPLDQSFVGRTYPTETYLVSRERIAAFADAIGAPDAAYRDPAAAQALGYPDVVAPPTFPVVMSWAAIQVLINDPDLGLDFSRVVHGEQRFAYTRPVHAGDRLVGLGTVEGIMAKGGHDFLTTRVDLATEAGDPVVSVWCKFVVRGEG